MATARQTPDGIMLRDGFSTKICPSSAPDIAFWEKTVKPFGVDGGDAIDITTMHNSVWRQFAARQLKTATEFTVKAAWDPAVYDDIVSLTNVNQIYTIHFPDGSTEDVWAFLKTFTPSELQEGTHPEADITFVPTNTNEATRAETAPNYITGAGTD